MVGRRPFNVSEDSGRIPTAPLPGFVAPMQAMLVDSVRPGDWIYEIKFDGYRAAALRSGNETRILSRNEKDLGRKFPEVRDAVAALAVQDAVIDGEIVALDDKGRSSFQLLQGFDMGRVRPPIVFYAFDLLRLNGKDLQGLPIEERKAKLEALLKKPPGVIRYSVSFKKNIEELLSRVRGLGLEGLIGKRTNSRYEAGKRTGAWVKIKLHKEQEFVIGGYTEPEGSRKHFGALLVGFYEGKNLKFAGRVGTGFSEKLLRSLFDDLQKIRVESCPFSNLPASGRNRWDQGLTAAEMKRCRWLKPSMVCQVKFTEWTRDDRLRQAVFLGIREDKNLNEVVREEAN
jgi:bifunctional non-homologous end joining protein LigD